MRFLPGISNPQTIRPKRFSLNIGIEHVLDLIVGMNDLIIFDLTTELQDHPPPPPYWIHKLSNFICIILWNVSPMPHNH